MSEAETRERYRYYYRDEKGNEFCVAKDYKPSPDVACRVIFGMSTEELAQYALDMLSRCDREKEA